MPPRRGRSKKVVDPPPDPAASEDAKPDIQQLEANLETATDNAGPSEQAAEVPTSENLPSDPLQSQIPHGLPNIPPADTPAAPTPVAAASPAPRGRASKTAQPRGNRRSAAQRAELARVADERDRVESEARAKEAAKAARLAGRGRGDGNRRAGRGGRGGFMGQTDREERAVVSGPFSGGVIHKDSRHIKRRPSSSGWVGFSAGATRKEGESRPSGRRSYSHMGYDKKTTGGSKSDGTLTIKAEPGSSADAKPVFDRDGDMRMNYIDGGYISSDEEDGVDGGMERVNIEDFGTIDLTQDDEDEVGYYAPVRVMRVERKDRAPGINAEGATDQDGEIAVDANDSVPETTTATSRKGKQKAAAEIQPPPEQKSFQAVYSDSSSPASPTTGPDVKPDPASLDLGAVNDDVPSSPEARRKGKERADANGRAARASPPALAVPGSEYQTREDLQEWERTQSDLHIMRTELGDPADRATDGAAATSDSRADKVYLFQFPPILPDLLPTNPTADQSDPDAMAVDPPNTTETPAIKLEPTTSATSDIPTSLSFPSGAVGKLRVRASGRVELDWGGTAMSMGLGTEAGFLQDLMLVSLPEGKGGMDGAQGEAVCMGRVRGKFVVGLDWAAMTS